jgi:hypothetical protein
VDNERRPAALRGEATLALGWTALAFALGAALRVRQAWVDDGLYWPDEVYQSLEPAHRWVFGYGLVAWEFIDGARNWALPALCAAVMKLCAMVGLEAPRSYLVAVRLAFVAMGLGTAWGTGRLARAVGAGPLAAAMAAGLFALSPVALYFAPRAMSETASALPTVWGLALLLDAERSTRARRVLEASLLGVATLLRLQSGLFCVGALVWLVVEDVRARRRTGGAKGLPRAAEVLLVLCVWAFLYGLLDRLTWGGWFHSALQYLKFNLVEGKSAQWGTSAFDYYARVLWTSQGVLSPLLAAMLLLAAGRGAPRVRALLAFGAAFVLFHSFVPHKELRFVVPALPLLFAAAGAGLDALRGREPVMRGACAVAGLALVIAGLRYVDLRFGQLGQYETARPQASAFDDSGSVNRLLFAAHPRADLCALKIEGVHLAWTGGISHLHRPVRMYSHAGPGRASQLFNYVITPVAAARGLNVVAREGTMVLARLGDGCRPDPGYSWRLP